MPSRQWDAPPASTYYATIPTGPSRLPIDPRDGPYHSCNAHVSPYSGLAEPADAWPTHAHEMSKPTDAYSHAHSIKNMPSPAMFSSAPLFHNRRASDEEEWRRYQHELPLRRAHQIPPLTSSTLQAHVVSEALSHREPLRVTSPVGARASTLAITSGDADPPRARVACSFCRVRKLRCDGATPCRHCERRNIGCVYAPAKTKGKASGRSSDNKNDTQDHALASNASRERGTKRSDPADIPNTKQYSPPSSQSFKRIRTDDGNPSQDSTPSDSSERSRGSYSSASSTPSSSMPGSDLAMIQNNHCPIPMEPTFGDREVWWDQLLGVFGRSRSTSTKTVKHLLTRFVQSNAVFFGLLHAPTLLGAVSGKQGYARADPALYLAVLAVSACDMHQTRIADERTSDMRSATEESRRLALRLSEMASDYLKTSTAHGSALTLATGQAASILALTQPDGSTEQNSLIQLAENVVRTLKLHETVSSREPLLQDSEPDSPLYWSRPLTSGSPESEVKYESMVRLCWTGLSHRCRKYIAQPDQDFAEVDLPEFILDIRPMAFWQPSLLPEHLPPPFFHSRDLVRRSAHLCRLAVWLSQLQKLKEVDERQSPSQETLEQVGSYLQSLDDLEKSFIRHRPQTEAEKHSVVGRTLQMFCRLHVWVRLTIWRRYKLWSNPKDARSDDSTDPLQSILFPQPQHHPTIEFWLTVVQEMIDTMQHDLDAHVVDQTTLHTSVSDVDTLARHVICACDLIAASGRAQPILGEVDRAINILKRVLAYAALNEAPDGLHVPDDVVERFKVAETRRAEVQVG